MRKIVIIAFLILFVALVVIFKIQNTEKNLNITANTTKIGVLLNGECLDQSYCQTHYEALEKIKNELNLEFIYRENTDKDCYNDIVNLIKRDDARIIIGVSHDFGEAMLKAADSFPNIYFLHASGTAYKKNMSSFFGRMYQARYLAGIVAGAETRTGKIGYVGAFPISEVIRGVNAFTLGVKSVRPDAKVYVRYVYSWTKAEPAKRASRQLITSRNVDVITSHTDTLQPIIEANKAGIYTIGYHFDNSHLFMDTYLTACPPRATTNPCPCKKR